MEVIDNFTENDHTQKNVVNEDGGHMAMWSRPCVATWPPFLTAVCLKVRENRGHMDTLGGHMATTWCGHMATSCVTT